MNDNFPELTPAFLAGQDLLYTQFNEVNFYVEDTEQEHLYYSILKRLFNDVNFKKIFPLNGKTNLIKHAKQNIGDKFKIYIADLDFDEILKRKENIDNVFYLDKYSIENYLLEKNGIFELIREKNPKLKNSDISNSFNYRQILKICKILLSELACTFVVIQHHSLGKEYFKINPARDFKLDINDYGYKNEAIVNYFNEVELLLKSIDRRYSLNAKCTSFKCHFRSIHNALDNIPGKYLLNLIKFQLVKSRLINDSSVDTFTYKLSKECNLDSFNALREEIIKFKN